MKKETSLLLRVETNEKAAFEKAAKTTGLSLSAWCRMHLRAAAVKEMGAMNEKPVFLES